MNIVNLTPHTLNIHTNNGNIIDVAPSGIIARVVTGREELEPIAGISVSRASFGAIEGLPEPADDTIYVVSGMVLARTNRQDVFSPGELIRDEKERVIGCLGLNAGTAVHYA